MSSVSVRHPLGLFVLCVVECCERFAGILLGSLLVLYLNERLGFGAAESARLSSYVVALGYAVAVGGGVLVDRVMGQRWAMVLGLVAMLAAFGLFVLGQPQLVAPAVILLSVGSGLFRPAITALVGMLYPTGDARRGPAYGWFYFAINLGGLLGPLAGSAVRVRYGWSSVFAVVLVAVSIALGVVVVGWRAVAPVQEAPKPADVAADPSSKLKIVPLAIVLLAVGTLGLTFAQTSGTLLLWARDFSRRELWGRTVPPDAFAALPSATVLVFAPVLAGVWRVLGARGREPSDPSKLALGLGLCSLAFALLMMGALVSGAGLASPLWLIGAKLLLTLGELVALPVGLAMASSLASARRTASAMGLSFGATALGYWLGGEAGRLWGLVSPPSFFALLALTALGAACFVAASARLLAR